MRFFHYITIDICKRFIFSFPIAVTVIASTEYPVENGDAITLTCNTDIPAPTSYEWYKSDVKVQNEIKSTLTIGNTQATAGAEYKCMVTNDKSSSAKSPGKTISFKSQYYLLFSTLINLICL